MSRRGRPQSRRRFLETAVAGSVGATLAPSILRASDRPLPGILERPRSASKLDDIRIGLVGAGGMGQGDAETALEIPGVKLVAAADVYDGREEQVHERFEDTTIAFTREYEEIVARDDIDAVIVATPDHWHQRICIDLLDSGKAVYCEKPMVQTLSEGHELIAAADRSGKTFQVGSQHLSGIGLEKAKELYEDGAIGELNSARGYWARNTPWGAWQWGIPDDASEQTVDWPRFLGHAPAVDFDPLRIFRWRCYRDYGTGVAGDLFVHFLSSLHFVLSSHGPERVMATGGLRFWKDGRDVPDFMQASLDYPAAGGHPAFNLSLTVNFMDGVSGETSLQLIGNEGLLEVWNDRVILRQNRGYDPLGVFKDDQQSAVEQEHGPRKRMLPPAVAEWRAEDGYKGAYFDHMVNFLEGVRSGVPVVEDARFGMRAAAAALCCNVSHFEGRIVGWDPEAMELTG